MLLSKLFFPVQYLLKDGVFQLPTGLEANIFNVKVR